mgnify:CR=1 FL=1
MQSKLFYSLEELEVLSGAEIGRFQYVFERYVFRKNIDYYRVDDTRYWYWPYLAKFFLREHLISEAQYDEVRIASEANKASSLYLPDNFGNVVFKISNISKQSIEIGYETSGISIYNRLVTLKENDVSEFIESVLASLKEKKDKSDVFKFQYGGFNLGLRYKGDSVYLDLEFTRTAPKKIIFCAEMVIDLFRVADFFRDFKRKYNNI